MTEILMKQGVKHHSLLPRLQNELYYSNNVFLCYKKKINTSAAMISYRSCSRTWGTTRTPCPIELVCHTLGPWAEICIKVTVYTSRICNNKNVWYRHNTVMFIRLLHKPTRWYLKIVETKYLFSSVGVVFFFNWSYNILQNDNCGQNPKKNCVKLKSHVLET